MQDTRTQSIQHTKYTRRHQKTDTRRPETTPVDIKKTKTSEDINEGFRPTSETSNNLSDKDKGREVGLSAVETTMVKAFRVGTGKSRQGR